MTTKRSIEFFDGFESETVPFGENIEEIQGKSAYDVAVDNGFIGTEAEWLTSLQGADGADGVGIPVGGTDGQVIVRAGGVPTWSDRLNEIENDLGDINAALTAIVG